VAVGFGGRDIIHHVMMNFFGGRVCVSIFITDFHQSSSLFSFERS